MANKKDKDIKIFRNMKEEMKRVSWTDKEDLCIYGKIVIGVIFSLGIGIYLVDLLIRMVLKGIDNLLRLIGA